MLLDIFQSFDAFPFLCYPLAKPTSQSYQYLCLMYLSLVPQSWVNVNRVTINKHDTCVEAKN